MRIFYLYSGSALRKKVYEKNYALYGKDYAARYGYEALDDFDICEKLENSFFSKIVDFTLNKFWSFLGGYGGSWYKVIALRDRLKQADIIFSTNDRVGIPLVLLRYFRLVPNKPIIYASIGLPTRLEKLRPRMFKFYKKAFNQSVKKIICYGYEENLKLEEIFGKEKIKFIPFGVDIEYFKPADENEDDYLLCIGIDPERDFELLFSIAKFIKCPILIITSKARMAGIKKKWKVLPKNISILPDVPFPKIRTFLANSKFVVLPVKENSYSGATTTLLQAMAMGKAVIVSNTGAIKEGYHLENNKNCVLVRPGDRKKFLSAVNALLKDKQRRKGLGQNARTTIEKCLSWENYVNNLFSVISQ